jgi:hypothetical protein
MRKKERLVDRLKSELKFKVRLNNIDKSLEKSHEFVKCALSKHNLSMDGMVCTNTHLSECIA